MDHLHINLINIDMKLYDVTNLINCDGSAYFPRVFSCDFHIFKIQNLSTDLNKQITYLPSIYCYQRTMRKHASKQGQ